MKMEDEYNEEDFEEDEDEEDCGIILSFNEEGKEAKLTLKKDYENTIKKQQEVIIEFIKENIKLFNKFLKKKEITEEEFNGEEIKLKEKNKMDEELNLKNIDWINQRERFLPPKVNLEPRIDKLVSEVVGKKIYIHDPRLMNLIVKWKKQKPQDSMEFDNFLQDPVKVTELKEIFNKDL